MSTMPDFVAMKHRSLAAENRGQPLSHGTDETVGVFHLVYSILQSRCIFSCTLFLFDSPRVSILTCLAYSSQQALALSLAYDS